MHRGSDQFNIRLPDGLRDKIKGASAASRRSMNAEIVYHLERAMAAQEALAGGEIGVKAPASVTEPSVLTHAQSHHQG